MVRTDLDNRPSYQGLLLRPHITLTCVDIDWNGLSAFRAAQLATKTSEDGRDTLSTMGFMGVTQIYRTDPSSDIRRSLMEMSALMRQRISPQAAGRDV